MSQPRVRSLALGHGHTQTIAEIGSEQNSSAGMTQVLEHKEENGARGGSRTPRRYREHVSCSFYVTLETLKALKLPLLATRRLHGAG
jgi:hypothetical protein